MTTLYFDTGDNHRTMIRLDNQELTIQRAKRDKSQQLLGMIAAILEKNNRRLTDLTAINYHVGPGSFTGLKVGAAIGNTLGFILGIPVNGQNIEGNQLPELIFTDDPKYRLPGSLKLS